MSEEHIVSLGKDEKIIIEVRKHMFVFYLDTLVLFVLAIIPPLFISPISTFLDKIMEGKGASLFLFFYLLWLLGIVVGFFLKWTDYYLDVWVITNQRVFDIEQKDIFHRDISVFRLDRLQDVTVEVKGIIATFLKFGDVHVHTAGENRDFIIKSAKDPLHVKRVLMETHREAIHRGQKIQNQSL